MSNDYIGWTKYPRQVALDLMVWIIEGVEELLREFSKEDIVLLSSYSLRNVKIWRNKVSSFNADLHKATYCFFKAQTHNSERVTATSGLAALCLCRKLAEDISLFKWRGHRIDPFNDPYYVILKAHDLSLGYDYVGVRCKHEPLLFASQCAECLSVQFNIHSHSIVERNEILKEIQHHIDVGWQLDGQSEGYVGSIVLSKPNDYDDMEYTHIIPIRRVGE